MAKIKNITIKNTNTLIINEHANPGDEIDLLDINQVDVSILNKKINDGIDEEYNRRLKQLEAKISAELKAEHITEISELRLKLSEYKNKLDHTNERKNDEIQMAVLKKEQEMNLSITKMESEFKNIQFEHENEVLKLKAVFDKKIAELEYKISQNEIQNKLELANKEEEIVKQQSTIDNLRLTKTMLNVKRIGEQLEHWCNNEYLACSQNGFQTCTWEKDNKSVKEEDDSKGTKADYIFKVYASDNFKDCEILTSVACEMKSEDPNSVNKKKNSDHYAKLDKDRNKKNCEYALLISELEWDMFNDVPIQKVPGYDKMYLVRPPYFMTFLNIVTTLGMKFKDIIISRNKEIEQFKDSQLIIDEFEAMKERLLNKPIINLEKEVNSINSEALKIKDSSEKIVKSVDKIVDNVLKTMIRNINDFNIQKVVKKIDN